MKNDRFLRALNKQPVDKTPVWIMRQAGRYLPEYRATRQKAGDFMTLCQTPELACEVTMQPLARFDLDAAILFSDILTIPDAMGLGLYFTEGEGPRFQKTIRSEADLKAVGHLDPTRDLGYVQSAVQLIAHELQDKVPLIGFSGSPWTLATYMIEGGSSKTFAESKKMLYSQPDLLHQLLQLLADNVVDYLDMQIHAGAEAVMVFDTWGGILSSAAYHEFSLFYLAQIVRQLKRRGHEQCPIILFTKGAGLWLESLADTGAAAIGLDWAIDIADARARIGDKVALQGNMDPGVLHGKPERIREEVAQILSAYGQGSGHVFNLGHGITPDINPEHVAALVEAVHELSVPYHDQTK